MQLGELQYCHWIPNGVKTLIILSSLSLTMTRIHGIWWIWCWCRRCQRCRRWWCWWGCGSSWLGGYQVHLLPRPEAVHTIYSHGTPLTLHVHTIYSHGTYTIYSHGTYTIYITCTHHLLSPRALAPPPALVALPPKKLHYWNANTRYCCHTSYLSFFLHIFG